MPDFDIGDRRTASRFQQRCATCEYADWIEEHKRIANATYYKTGFCAFRPLPIAVDKSDLKINSLSNVKCSCWELSKELAKQKETSSAS